jgi:catechol 2,3-dioxygenase-like lactoylglutathione lyase family enzyme
VFEETAFAEYMLPYTGNKPQKRHAVLAINIQGGGGFEVWQYFERTPLNPLFRSQLGDLGIFICKMKSFDIPITHMRMQSQGLNISPIVKDPRGELTFYVTDPYQNIFQFVPCSNKFYNDHKDSGGVDGIVTGVTDIDQSLAIYSDILGFDQIIYDVSGTFDDFKEVQGGTKKFRRVLLGHREERKGPFSEIFGSSFVELVQAIDFSPRKIYEGRFWGDPGYIQLCFDIQGFDELGEYCKTMGSPFMVDSTQHLNQSFDMGEAAGHFAYIEDPDGTLIELVETHKIPVVRKLGWYINLTRLSRGKRLPKWMLKTLRFNRVS